MGFVTLQSLNFKQILGLRAHIHQLVQLEPRLTPRSFSRAATLTVKLHEFPQFKPGLLQLSDFSNEDITKWLNRPACLSRGYLGSIR